MTPIYSNSSEVISEYLTGKTISEIARKYSKHHKTISKILKNNNITIREYEPVKVKKVNKIDYNPLDRDKLIIELYQSGKGSSTIAKMLSVGKRTVLTILHENSIEIRETKKADIKTITTKYNSGLSVNDIAREFGVSYSSIKKKLDKHDVKLRKPADTNSIIPLHLHASVVEWYNSDLSSYDICDKLKTECSLDIHPNCVQNFLYRKTKIRSGRELKEHIARKQKNKNYRTKPERFVEDILNEFKVQYDWQFPIGEWTYDFRVNNTLIEVNYWHSMPQRRQRDGKKYKIAIRNGYKVCYVWEHEIKNQELVRNRIRSICLERPIINFSDISVSQIDHSISTPFLQRYHYQGAGRIGDVIIGAYYNSELIGVCVFAQPTRLEIAEKQGVEYSDIRELTRLCINPEYQAKNLATWFIARSRKLLRGLLKNVKTLVSFADPNFGHCGTIYKADNWVLDGETAPGYWYINNKSVIIHKKTVWNKAITNNISESEQAKIDGLIKVTGQPKYRYIRKI